MPSKGINMIKVIATDLDGTLLDGNHLLNEATYKALMRAKEKGIRIIIASGRDYVGVLSALNGYEVECDYITASGAELIDSKGNEIFYTPMSYESIEEIVKSVSDMPISLRFCGRGNDYVICKPEELLQLIVKECRLFQANGSSISDEEIRNSILYKRMFEKMASIPNFEALKEIQVHKVFITAREDYLIAEVENRVSGIRDIVSASSFINNTEITNIQAQKGPVLKKYIEKLGFDMSEVMVFGDSMNDYSMMSMDFGMTVAMDNGMDEIKKVAKYTTKSNTEDGVAWMIDKVIGI